jgi:hypothetical protein
MKRFFDLTFRPFFVLAGTVTALGALNAFWPRWAVEKLELISYNQDYIIILQHWGILLGWMGVFMIVAAFRAEWRNLILIYSAMEKAFFVYLVATNVTRPYARGFWTTAVVDAAVVLYTVAYFGMKGLSRSHRDRTDLATSRRAGI